MALHDLTLVYRDPATLRPDPNNARTHSKAQVAQIAASIKNFGFANPILIDEDLGIIAGHGRLLAAKSLGLSEAPTITLAGLTPAQKRALRLADNKIALNAGWDFDLLKGELEALRLDDFDMELTGFSIAEIDVTLGEKADPTDDIIPESPASPASRPGDIWLLDHHRVGCGDVKDAAFLTRLLDGKLVDAAFLDPPFNVKIDGHAGGKGKIKHREFAEASGEMTDEAFTAYLEACLGACARVSRSGAIHFVVMDHGHLDQLFVAGAAVYNKRLNLVVWNKSNAGMGSLYRSKHELIAVYKVGSDPHRNNVQLGKYGRNRTNVWDYASVNSFKGSRRHDLALHPTVKPVALVADAIIDVTAQGDLVLDAFLGSGTTLLAAERAGRRFVGLDIDPAYVDVALERWVALTGRVPILQETGQAFDVVKTNRVSAA